jgi:hypothetical protein
VFSILTILSLQGFLIIAGIHPYGGHVYVHRSGNSRRLFGGARALPSALRPAARSGLTLTCAEIDLRFLRVGGRTQWEVLIGDRNAIVHCNYASCCKLSTGDDGNFSSKHPRQHGADLGHNLSPSKHSLVDRRRRAPNCGASARDSDRIST